MSLLKNETSSKERIAMMKMSDNAYQKIQEKIAGKIGELQGALADHAIEQSQDIRNWSFPAELIHAGEKLTEILNFLGKDKDE